MIDHVAMTKDEFIAELLKQNPSLRQEGDMIIGIRLKKPTTNPWHKSVWDTDRQANLVEAIGEKAANSIAKAAGSYVGAEAPNEDY